MLRMTLGLATGLFVPLLVVLKVLIRGGSFLKEEASWLEYLSLATSSVVGMVPTFPKASELLKLAGSGSSMFAAF